VTMIINNNEIALKLLEETENYYKRTNCKNHFSIRKSRQASILLKSRKLRRCFTKRLKAIDYHPLRGALTNISVERIPKKAFKIQLTTKKQIKAEYPLFTKNYPKETSNLYGDPDHIALCLEDRFNDALKAARKTSDARTRELYELETVSTIALCGHPSLALEMSKSLARKDELTLILVIEFYRNNQVAEAKDLLEKMKSNKNFYMFDSTHIALGITNHIPWKPYPFPDY